jgi:hypothetical protein
VFVTMEARTPCPLCRYQVSIRMYGRARVNKRSMRVEGPLLGWFEFTNCPECGTDVRSLSLAPRSAYRLDAESEAEVISCRQRKWGISDRPGPLVEAFRRVA